MKIDLRSDTVTIPDEKMVQAMMMAKIGDDVLGDESSVTELERYAVDLFQMEAALFCPSGTMTNQIGGMIGSSPMTSIILEESSHMFLYELGGLAFHSRAQPLPIKGERGKLTASLIEERIVEDNPHTCKTSMVCLENSTNRGGGAAYHLQTIKEISALCKKKNLHLHLDGARLFNALIKNGESPSQYGQLFDSISICLSKGLGAPVGSLLLSSKENILKAKKLRKIMGGGMRQSGYLAAAGLYALQNNRERLSLDHQLALSLESLLKEMPFVSHIEEVETNIIIFDLAPQISPSFFVQKLAENQIYAYPFGPKSVRFVTHLNLPAQTSLNMASCLKKISSELGY